MSERLNILFVATLKGGYPALDLWEEEEGGEWEETEAITADFPWPAEWSKRLRQALDEDNQQAAAQLYQAHLEAHFYPHGNFDDHPDLFSDAPDEIAAQQITAGPLVEMQDGYPIFHRWTAVFSLSLPVEVLLRWTLHSKPVGDDPGFVEWSEEGFETWKEKNGFWGFQDGVCWSLRGVPYELDGMGEHGCEPDREQLVEAVWEYLLSRSESS